MENIGRPVSVPLFLIGAYNQVRIANAATAASGNGGAYLGSTGDSQAWISGGTHYSGSGNNWVVDDAAGSPVVADLGGGEFTIYAATGLTTGNNWDITTKRIANFHADLITFDKPLNDISFGTTPALSGKVRASNNTLIVTARNAANNADIWGVYINGSNELIIGDSNGPNAGVRVQNHAGGKVGFFAAAPVVQQTRGATWTNSLTSGGTANNPANWTSLATYSTDAAAIRNWCYQAGQVLVQYDTALRAYGLLT